MKKFYEIKPEDLIELSKAMTCARIRSIRRSYKLTQKSFAGLLDISFHTYKNWEIGHRKPCTSAVALLIIAEQDPKVFLEETKKD